MTPTVTAPAIAAPTVDSIATTAIESTAPTFTGKVTRQQQRAAERRIVRRAMPKKERRVWVRMKNPLKREIAHETVKMVIEQFMQQGSQQK